MSLYMMSKVILLITELMQITKEAWIRCLGGCLEILFLYSLSELTSHTQGAEWGCLSREQRLDRGVTSWCVCVSVSCSNRSI